MKSAIRTLALTLVMLPFLGMSQIELVDKDSLLAQFAFPSFSYNVPVGSDRLLVFIAANEYGLGMNYEITGVSYGGQSMTSVSAVSATSTLSLYRTEIQVFYLLESGISAASNSNFNVTYNMGVTTGLSGVYYSAMVINNVDQLDPIEAVQTRNASSGSTLGAASPTVLSPNDAIISLIADAGSATVYSLSQSILQENISAVGRSSAMGWLTASSDTTVSPSFTSGASTSRLAFTSFKANSNGGGVLPVEMTSFSARKEANSVRIAWQTATETNSDRFIVERSEDFRNWDKVDEQPAQGHSTGYVDYALYDYEPLQTDVYYRIVQIDIDGQSEVFGPLSVKHDQQIKTAIFPNPADHSVTVLMGDDARNVLSVSIYDLGGKCALTTNQSNIDLSALESGVYFVSINGEQHQKLVVSH